MNKKKYCQKDDVIPNWIRKGNYEVSLDKYYTNIDIAKYCYNSLLSIAKKHNFNVNEYIFLEPSAGDGAFYNLLPKNKIGIDLEPEGKGIKKQDFFDWIPNKKEKYITIGNPPFGLRGWLALAFINKAAEFSDLVGFILPMYFASDGKGSAKNRVKGLTLLHSEELPSDVFHNGKPIKINTVWQVWGKTKKKNKFELKDYSIADIFTVCTNPQRRCGLDKIDKYDLFIPSTFYKSAVISDNFNDITYGAGYGIIINKQKNQIRKYLKTVDWLKYSIRATNHCRHIGKKQIIDALLDGGFKDEKPRRKLITDYS
ncbi:MAG TPA: hypothetical protein P5530_01200 [Candidatus Diapherotrites archaeon]|nr:hypothetical protein [Candidatus Diapherotrites archaeon]